LNLARTDGFFSQQNFTRLKQKENGDTSFDLTRSVIDQFLPFRPPNRSPSKKLEAIDGGKSVENKDFGVLKSPVIFKIREKVRDSTPSFPPNYLGKIPTPH
jgi:hypothetical protein